MVFRNRLLLVFGLAVVYYLNPLYIRSSAFSAVRALHGYVDLTPIEDPDSLKAAVANVTTDIHQLTALLDDFFQRQPDDSAETALKEYLRRKATRKHRDLEYYLDWILGFYKFAWPFVLVYALTKLSSAKEAHSARSEEVPRRKKKAEADLKLNGKSLAGIDSNSAGLNAVLRDSRPQSLGQRRGSTHSLH